MKRIFVAVDISDEVRKSASNYIEFLCGIFPDYKVKWDKPEKLHLTLKFIGDIDNEQLHKLMIAVEKTAAKISSFNLNITDTGVFPNAKQAKVLWIDVKDEAKNLEKLNKILESECEKQGFPTEQRQFKAHLTIARMRETENLQELITRHLQEKIEPVEFKVSEISIYSSELYPTGSIYKKIKSFTLEK